ncbi:MAG: hypothetical protein PUC12_13665, partial [Clostridiales bacterium]|nr:hypothetical protein [Clostridiales bacterium]
RSFFDSLDGNVVVDFSDEKGNNVATAEYSTGTASSRIINDISEYFKNGTIPENTYNSMSDYLYQDRTYSYDELVKKPDMVVTKAKKDYKNLMVAKCIDTTLSDLKKEKNTIIHNGNVAVRNNDSGDYILVTKGALKHGLAHDRTGATKLISANIAEAIRNGIKVNVSIGKRNKSDSSYIIMGKLESNSKLSKGTYYYRIIVSRYESNNQGLYYIDGMYSIKAQKEKTSAARIATGVTANADSFPGLYKIKVSDFLNEVKDYYGDSLSEDVNNHFGRTRGKSDIDGLLFQDRVNEPTKDYEMFSKEVIRDLAQHIKNGDIGFEAGKSFSIGNIPELYNKLLGIGSINLVLNTSHAYENMSSEEEAINANRWRDIEYHDISPETYANKLSKIADPEAIYAMYGNNIKPRITIDVGNNWVVSMELYSNNSTNDKSSRLNNAIVTVFKADADNYFNQDKFEQIYKKGDINYSEDTPTNLLEVVNNYNLRKSNLTEFVEIVKEYEQIHNIKNKYRNNADYISLNQDRDTTPSNREILVTALETAAVNDRERETLEDYRENIEQLNELDKELDVVNGALKEMFFNPRTKPTESIKELQKQADSIRRRMKYYDGKLLQLESTTALKNLLQREKQAAVKKQRRADAEKLKAYRTEQNERFERMQKRYRQAAKQKAENRKRIEARNKVIKRVEKLNAWLEKPNNKKYIPARFMNGTVELLKGLNQDGMNVSERLDELRERMAGYTEVPKNLVDR